MNIQAHISFLSNASLPFSFRMIPVLLLGASLALAAGCNGSVDLNSQPQNRETAETASTADLERTLKLRQAYVAANSEEELVAAKKALIADLQNRYAGIDCHAPQDAIRPHYVLFRQLMQEWNAIGWTIEDVKAISGKPSSENKDSVTYVFDNGELAPFWTLRGRPRIVEVIYRDGQ